MSILDEKTSAAEYGVL